MLDKLFFTEHTYISSNLCMQLGLPSLDHVFISSFLLLCVVKTALDGCPTSETAPVLWPGVWWRCDPHSQCFTQHHWPSSSSYTTPTSVQVSFCPVTALWIRISDVWRSSVSNPDPRWYQSRWEESLGRSCSKALPTNAATATGRQLCCSCRASAKVFTHWQQTKDPQVSILPTDGWKVILPLQSYVLYVIICN